MGAITKIRQVSPYFLATVAVLFIAFMVIQDSSCSTIRDASQSAENTVIAEVNGVGITLAEYERRVRVATDRQRQSNPEQELDDESIRQQVFTQMVDEVLRAEAAKELGISVTTEEIVDVMVRNPPQELQFFKDSTGTFDRELHVRLFTNPDQLYNLLVDQGAQPEEAQRQRDEWKANLIEIEDYVRTQKLEEALRAAVGAAASVPSPALAKANYLTNNSTADVRFIGLSADALGDDAVTVSDADIAAYYEKNKAYYIQKPARQLAYTLLRIQPSAKDTARALRRSQKLMELLNQQPTPQKRSEIFQSEMRNGGQAMDFTPSSNIDPSVLTVLKSLNAGDVFGPLTTGQGIQYVRLDERRSGTTPTVRASHILIEFGSNKDSARAEAQRILGLAKKGDFAALAQQYSKDPGSAAMGGDLGYFGAGRMVEAFEKAAFAASVNDVVGPVETQFGWHIIKVTDRQTDEFRYATITIKPLTSDATKQGLMHDAAEMEQEITDGMVFDTVAARRNLTVAKTAFFSQQTPVLGKASITEWAYEHALGNVLRKEIPGAGILIATISEIRTSGTKPLDDVKEDIRRILVRRAKVDALKQKAEQIAQACSAAGDLAAASSVDPSLTVSQMLGCKNNGQLTGFGGEYAATNAAFTQPIGSIGQPVRGESGWFILVTDNRTEASMNQFEANMAQELQQLSARSRTSAYYSWFQKLRESATIVDNRDSRD